ncbi:5-formyltetrahydrofolate cyclo-ligase [Methylobacterium mesophilicum]|uniref:5-formyltetrahydrofolate cyclo-ligase n=1 Tax=Methylobacterium mesophilicum TaxID=39956 RepID=UPI002F35C3DA
MHVSRATFGVPAQEAPLRRHDLPWLAAVVLFGGLAGPLLLMLGLSHTSAASGSLLLNLEGLATMLIAWVVFRENVDRRLILGAFAILVGAVVLSWNGEGVRLDAGAALIAVACLAWAPDGLLFREWRAGDALVAGRFGLSEPDPSLPPVEPDALIVPLAAFDRTGQRIGYGRGYYDGAIARLSRTSPVLTVGIGFAAQEVERVPAEPHDRPLQYVITEAGVIRCDRTA